MCARTLGPGTAGVVVRRATVEELLDLRAAVLRPGRPRDTARFEGDAEPTTRHFGAFLSDTGAVVSAVSFLPRPYRDAPAWQLRGMATRSDVARTGIGSHLVRTAIDELRRDGPTRLWCRARVTAAGFYARNGWIIVSDPFDIPGIGPHVVMLLDA